MEPRMSPNRILSGIAAAAPRALLTLTLVAGLAGSVAAVDKTLNEAPVPGFYESPQCVASISKDTKIITLFPANAENPNAPVSFAFKKLPKGVKAGDLVVLHAPKSADSGDPKVTVKKSKSPSCKRYVTK
jgi:hypothetical protein